MNVIMIRGLIHLLLVALLFPLLQGCTSSPLVLTQAMHDSTVEVRLGRFVDVELAENPSTGWTWRLQTSTKGVLKPAGEHFTPGPGASRRVGVGGIRVFHYRAAAVGEVRLVYALVPPGSGGKASDETFTISIHVNN